VPPRSPERIAEALRELLADDERRAAVGAAAAARAERYAWSRVAEATLRAYAAILRRPAAAEAAL
jgi:glycosyltransferase involved in cell wall biosynthesis